MTEQQKPRNPIGIVGAVIAAIAIAFGFGAKHFEGLEGMLLRRTVVKAVQWSVTPEGASQKTPFPSSEGSSSLSGISAETLLKKPKAVPFVDRDNPCRYLASGSVERLQCEALR